MREGGFFEGEGANGNRQTGNLPPASLAKGLASAQCDNSQLGREIATATAQEGQVQQLSSSLPTISQEPSVPAQ